MNVFYISTPSLRWWPWDIFRFFKVCSDAKERVGLGKQREATAPIKSLVKLQPWFLSLRWKTCLRQNCSLCFSPCSEGPAFGQDTDYDGQNVSKTVNIPCNMKLYASAHNESNLLTGPGLTIGSNFLSEQAARDGAEQGAITNASAQCWRVSQYWAAAYFYCSESAVFKSWYASAWLSEGTRAAFKRTFGAEIKGTPHIPSLA